MPVVDTPTPPTPPDWMLQLMQSIALCVDSKDPVRMRAWIHEDLKTWHVDVAPTILDEGGELYVQHFEVHVSRILALLNPVDVMADVTSISISGRYIPSDTPNHNNVHIVIHLAEDDDDEDEDAEPEKNSLN
jgi:hypothetical protein